MPSISDELTRTFGRLAPRRLPPAWVQAEPVLVGTVTYADAYGAVRDWLVDPDRSDATIRALARIGHDDPDAVIVLLNALAGGLRGWRQTDRGQEYRSEELANLVTVILDATDLDDVDRLAPRLLNRAHRRTSDRFRAERRLWDREVKAEFLAHFASTGPDVADVAIDRARLDEFTRSVRRAIDAGDLPAEVWTMFRDNHLRPQVGYAPVRQDRSRTYRATKQIRRLAHTL